MEKGFIWLTEKTELLLSKWWGFLGYVLLMFACLYVWNWDGIDRFVYVTNGLIVILLLNANRRDSLATHKKLDDLVPDLHTKIEKKTEKEIEEL